MNELIVIKRNLEGKETWRYSGEILERWPNGVLLVAYFNRSDLLFHNVLLREGDRFVEVYYTDRWYNIFEIHDKDTDELKAWYCNVAYPARIQDGTLDYIDLALDLLVYPDGQTLVLDEDEFAALQLNEQDQLQARTALVELQQLFAQPEQMRMG